MIMSWGNSRSRRFYEEGKLSKFRSLDIDAADELLAALDAATSLNDLKPLRSVGLHKPYRCINNTSDYTLNVSDKGFALI